MSNDDMLFNMSSNEVMNDKLKEDFQSWVIKNTVKIEEINCDDFIFSKILQGDKSDNIQSVVTWTKRTSSGSIRNYSITEKQALQILEKYRETEGNFHIDHFFSSNQVDTIVSLIHEVVGKSTIEEIRVRFNQNLDLMLLHYNTIPEGILKSIYNEIDRDFSVEPQLSGLTQMEKILEGTEWSSTTSVGKGAPKGFDPFATLKLDDVNKLPETKQLNTLF
jgi:5'-3' exonuclease